MAIWTMAMQRNRGAVVVIGKPSEPDALGLNPKSAMTTGTELRTELVLEGVPRTLPGLWGEYLLRIGTRSSDKFASSWVGQ